MNRVKLPRARSMRDAENMLQRLRHSLADRTCLRDIGEIFRDAGNMPWQNHNTIKFAPRRGTKK